MAEDSGGRALSQGPAVYTTVAWVSNTAVPLFYLDEEVASAGHGFNYISSNVASHPDAVMGGSFVLGQKRYGLTVAHAWKHRRLRPHSQPMPPATARQAPTFSFMDDFSEGSQDDSEDDPEDGSVDETVKVHIVVGGKLPTFPDVPTYNHPVGVGQAGTTLVRKIGRIRYSSSGEPSDELDWAVIEFDDSWLESQDYENFEIAIDPDALEDEEQGFYDILPEINLFPGPSSLENSRPISMIGREETILSGVIKPSPALLSLSGSDKMSSAQVVAMDRALTFGDCGRWIFDTDGVWYGHIVAGIPGTGSAYIAPAWKIKQEIEFTTELTMTVDRMIMEKSHYTVPQVPQKHESIGTTEIGKGKRRGVQESQLHPELEEQVGFRTGKISQTSTHPMLPKRHSAGPFNRKRRSQQVAGHHHRAIKSFPCAFHHYGCNASFASKNEWKRHVASQHMQLGAYRCDMGGCASEGGSRGYNDFNRKDLFTQHCRRMHAPWVGSKGGEETAFTKDIEKFEQKLESIRERCWLELRKPPEILRCGFCRESFVGPSAWDSRMEHVGRHYENDGCTAEDEKVDPELREWAIDEGLIVREGRKRKWWLVGLAPRVEEATTTRRLRKRNLASPPASLNPDSIDQSYDGQSSDTLARRREKRISRTSQPRNPTSPLLEQLMERISLSGMSPPIIQQILSHIQSQTVRDSEARRRHLQRQADSERKLQEDLKTSQKELDEALDTLLTLSPTNPTRIDTS
nr:hypothetical protein LTR18_010233 [Exophiala xenobiotica]